MKKQLLLEFEVELIGDDSAGIIGFYDRITVAVESGKIYGEKGEKEEFIERIRSALADWFDASTVRYCGEKEQEP